MTEHAGPEVETLTIRIPMRLQRRGGRKLIVAPGGAVPTPKPRRDETLIKALVRAHRWRRQIESGRAKSITDLAEQEGVTDAYVCRLLPLTCLAPDIVEAILDGRQPKGLRLAEMLGNGPLRWDEQRFLLGYRHPPRMSLGPSLSASRANASPPRARSTAPRRNYLPPRKGRVKLVARRRSCTRFSAAVLASNDLTCVFTLSGRVSRTSAMFRLESPSPMSERTPASASVKP
jgi:hypothetical protein